MSQSPGSVFLLLPAYNESENLPALLSQAAAAGLGPERLKVVIVDDGSTDGTENSAWYGAGRLDITVLKHPRNLGLAAALRTGFGRILKNAQDQDVVVTMDADNTHPPALIPAMLSEIESGASVVIASRYAPGGKEFGLAPHRRLFSRVCSRLFRFFFKIKGVRDYTCGYRMIRVADLRRLSRRTKGEFFNEEGFACGVELLIELARGGALIDEVPLELRYDQKKGKSKMKAVPTIIRMLALLIRLRPAG